MKALPLVPSGCTLSPEGLVEQRARAESLRPAVEGLDRFADGFRVRFGPAVDRDVVTELVETERGCCSFFDIGWDGRVLSVSSSDGEAVARLATLFEEVA